MKSSSNLSTILLEFLNLSSDQYTKLHVNHVNQQAQDCIQKKSQPIQYNISSQPP